MAGGEGGGLCIRKVVVKKTNLPQVNFEILLKFQLFLEKTLKFKITNLVPSASFHCKTMALFSKKLLWGQGSSLCRTLKWLLLKISQSTLSVYTLPHLYCMLPAGNNGTRGETLLVDYFSKDIRKEGMEVRVSLPS